MDATILLGIIATAIALLFIAHSARDALLSGDLKKMLAEPPADASTESGTGETAGPQQTPESIDALARGNQRLDEYLALASNQVRISFRLSVAFAALGLLILLATVFFPTSNAGGSALAQLLAGIALVGLSVLFFNRVRATHHHICESLEKMRKRDRHMKSRELCETVGDDLTRDALRVRLALHYAGVSRALETTKVITRSPLSGN